MANTNKTKTGQEVTPEASVDTKATIDTSKATTVAREGETDAKKAQEAAGHPLPVEETFRVETTGMTNREPEVKPSGETLAEKIEGKDMVDQTESEPKTGELTKKQLEERQAVIEGKLRSPNHQNRNYLD